MVTGVSFGGVFFLPLSKMNPPFGKGAEQVTRWL